MKYFGKWITDNGTRNQERLIGSNKSQLEKVVREKAEGNRTERGAIHWRIEDETGKTVAAGGMDKNGRRWKAKKNSLQHYF